MFDTIRKIFIIITGIKLKIILIYL